MRERLPLLLLISIPAAAVLMGVIALFLAYQGPDQEIAIQAPPLSKTSWREDQDANGH